MVDDARFEHVYDAHGPAVLRYCTYSLGSRDAAEDAAAETFARFLEKGERVPVEHTEAWLIRVARNLCASQHRATARQRRLAIESLVEGAPANGWTAPDAWPYVHRLDETGRLAIYLRVVEERPFAEVARMLGKSEAASKMTFYRAIERLRREMHRDGAIAQSTLTEDGQNA